MKLFLGLVLLVAIASPGVAQTPPATAAVASPAPASPAPAPAPPPPPPAETWLPRAGVELIGLDKITTKLSPLSGRVGQPIKFGTLSVTVRICIVRGPDQPADQAAFLDVTDSRDLAFAFHGWMLLSSPGVSVIEHPVYDVRLAACRP